MTTKSDAIRLLRTASEGELAAAIVEVLRSRGGNGLWLGVAEMAQLADMSVRSFQRRLNAEGGVYSELIDNVRSEMATDMLENSDATVSEIAQRLGYTNQGNFSRAYQRWTGRKPSAVRGR